MSAPLSIVLENPGSLLLIVTHLLGIGHLTRMAAIGRAFAAEGHRVTLVTGGRPVPLVDMAGLNVVQLPPVHCTGTDFRTLLGQDGKPIGESVLFERKERLLAALDSSAPELIITELYPFGRRQLAGEFMGLLEAARAKRPRPLVLASVRDVLNPPSKPARADEALVVLGRFYDRVLVHGDPAVTRLWDSWPVTPRLADRLIDTGLICDAAPGAGLAGEEDPVGEGNVVVSGGGSAAGLPLYEAAIEAAALLQPQREWRILVGAGVETPDFERLQASAVTLAEDGRGIVQVERARPDFRHLMAGAAVSVSQAGYNTMVDVALARVRAVVVPFEAGREQEQALRARRLEEEGLVERLPEAELSPSALADAVTRALRKPRPDAAESRGPCLGRRRLDLSGLPSTVTAVGDALRRGRAREAALKRFQKGLDALGSHGRFLDLWWRDDDAVAATPALDRLLALSSSANVPVALAVIPARAQPSLAQALALQPLASVLQHGYSHENHAPDDEKKMELGWSPPGLILTELEVGRRKLEGMFPGRFLQVLTPPWNRIDPALIGLLTDVGFCGLSTFKSRPAREAARGLVAVNTHCDPIAWRRGGGLREEAEIWAELALQVEARLSWEVDADEPLGLLTHHLVHDEWTWRFVEDFVGMLAHHPSVRLRTAAAAFKP